MLVTFHAESQLKITFTGDIATRLLRLMGQGTDVPGVLSPEGVIRARCNLAAAIELEEPGDGEPESGDEADRVVAMRHRALPLLRLLEAAEADETYVTWKEGWSIV